MAYLIMCSGDTSDLQIGSDVGTGERIVDVATAEEYLAAYPDVVDTIWLRQCSFYWIEDDGEYEDASFTVLVPADTVDKIKNAGTISDVAERGI